MTIFWSLLPLLYVAAGTVAVTLVALRLKARWNSGQVEGSLVSGREWPALMSARDGLVLEANPPMQSLSVQGSRIDVRLGDALGLTAAEIYRMSRVALKDGIALNACRLPGSDHPVVLTVQIVASDQLLWQLVPRNRLGALFPDGASDVYESAPFAYARFGALDGPAANELFRELFADAALEMLSEQIDMGVFVSGRIVLPGRDGTDKLAMSALRIDKAGIADLHEVFLFLPDGETVSQISAAETLEALPVSLLHLDIEGRIFWGNAQARQMLGDLFGAGRMLDDIVQPLGRSLETLMADVRSGRASTSGEMVRLKDGEFDTFAQVLLTRMVVQGQPSIVAVLTDASELRSLEDRFAQSQKMEAVGKLAGGVAHDFNNVLTAISGNCDLLLLRKDASHPDFSDLTQISQNSKRAAALVKQLLAFSRKQTMQPKLLSVQDVVTDTLYLLDRLIGETITLSLDHGRDLGSVRADNQQLEQALMNLVVNARDAMPQGGVVTIATRNRRLTAEQVFLGVSVPVGEYVEISVSDNGTGIDAQVIDKVFDPFFTTKPQGEGTGLGLSTVYGIVKQSGGYIYVENRPEGGARFTILLPRAYADLPEDASPVDIAQESEDLTGEGAIMLVEDEAPVRSFASRALKLRGYRVIEADSAEQAMALLEKDPDEVDVLVSDVVMPGMDGPTFASRARELRPDLKVVFISGYAEDSFQRNLTDHDFLFLPKPFSLNELTATVKVAMDGNSRTN